MNTTENDFFFLAKAAGLALERSVEMPWLSNRAAKPAADFPFAGGRRAQRAYFDACRDLAAPLHGLRVLRVPAPERSGALAFRRFTEALEHIPA